MVKRRIDLSDLERVKGIRPESSDPADDRAAIEEAVERCMREKGWAREP